MEAIVQQVLGQHEALIRARKVEVEVSRPLPPVLGHPLYVQEVLSNLVNNSLKYLGEENPAPTLSISAQALGDYVRYSVRDNGIGIAQEDIDKLFRMFKRLTSQQTAKIQGHGLGLSIVERFVKKMGGTVGVQSRVGEGSEFFITLPSTQPSIPPRKE
jgi:signal transduction histidine kinase